MAASSAQAKASGIPLNRQADDRGSPNPSATAAHICTHVMHIYTHVTPDLAPEAVDKIGAPLLGCEDQRRPTSL
jgi:hypothetical protein